MSKKISLGVAATIAIIAMAVTFSLTMVVSMKMFNTTVSSVKNKERQYNKLSEIDRFVRAGEYFTIDEDTLNDRLAAGYMNGINDKYAVYYTAKEYSEKQSVEKGTLTGIGVAVVNDTSSGYARIIRLYDNSPAAEAGMQVGGFITAINEIIIGEGTTTGRMVTITDNSHGDTTIENMKKNIPERILFSKGRVCIGKKVWIGDKATILPNVTIGDGAIIGANAVVSKDIPPYCIAAGNPARIIKNLNNG